MFDVELALAEAGSKSHTIILRRDYQEFRALHLALDNLITSSKKDVTLPALPQYMEGSTDAQMAEALTTYLYDLMAIPDVTASRQFLSLLNDHDGAGGAETSGLAPESAVDFLLQPCAPTSLYVPRRAKHEEDVEVSAGSTVLWRFSVGDGLDISFKGTFRPHAGTADTSPTEDLTPLPVEIVVEGRFPQAGSAVPAPLSPDAEAGRAEDVQGCYSVPAESLGGVCSFCWDNSYSRLRGKQQQGGWEGPRRGRRGGAARPSQAWEAWEGPEFSRVVGLVEELEDEVAQMAAKKEQAEAEAVIALAKQRRWSIEKEKFERRMLEALARGETLGEQVKALRAEKAGLEAEVGRKEEEAVALREARKRAEREREVLAAEKQVWTLAHSGVQAELTSLTGTLERERGAHEDTRGAWKKAKEAAQRAKGEAEVLRARLAARTDERALQTAQEELGSARAEVRDLGEALEETAAENETLRAQMKLLARHVKQQKQEIAELRERMAVQARIVAQLKGEKRLLVKEIKARSGSAPFAELKPEAAAVLDCSTTSGTLLEESVGEAGGLEGVTGSLEEEPRKGGGLVEGEGSARDGELLGSALPLASSMTEALNDEGGDRVRGKEEAGAGVVVGGDEEEKKEDTEGRKGEENEVSEHEGRQHEEMTEGRGGQPARSLSLTTLSPCPLPSGQAPAASPTDALSSSDSAPPPKPCSSPTKEQNESFPILKSVGHSATILCSPERSNRKKESSASSTLDKDERYTRLISQLRNVTERRKQLLLLCEEDPQNENIKQMVADLEGVLANIKTRMRVILEAAGESGSQRRG
ncbi:conserved unknown protein [Nannochloropsis gaditana]|uniref:PX domain-containing protein n=2 Tax=Nannochloropsis gaditana TaxID=72520 RepID=W7T666_9STRA|nr:conserved unknown protein [Nannochloropsis gaditana]